MVQPSGPTALTNWIDVDPQERTPARVAEEMGVSDQTIRNWRDGATVPGSYHRALLAILLDDAAIKEVGAWREPTVEDPRASAVGVNVERRIVVARERWDRIARAKAPAAQDGGAP